MGHMGGGVAMYVAGEVGAEEDGGPAVRAQVGDAVVDIAGCRPIHPSDPFHAETCRL